MISYEKICELNDDFKQISEETIYDFNEDEIKDHIVSIDGQIQIITRIKKTIGDEFTSYIKKLRKQKENIQAENLRRKKEEDNVEILELKAS
ncbi:hypothetical protein [Pseudobacteriovorax antillogorgiicola]|uniref:Uncharacterized protein n=1 Tax=Pseudobacteriovorax antillogorgiicola TaxID=1513793 RepID=A0A1Y6CNU6_9BACT|nr:hypothetical protein [Pseudobacteriovorax antillogorgiicola]TCS44225.1 hypothetical protein EDD56_13425 [Pseudobacteriovorax antillogorgiicola]SMF80600.1 hypothetical protein SAMN06296036_13526 [Pseudobacteriovorax antillogorgiicola]